MQIKNCVSAPARTRIRRNPPSIQLWNARRRNVEVNLIEPRLRHRADRPRRLQNKLPLPLIKQERQGRISTRKSCQERQTHSAGQPASAHRRGRGGNSVTLCRILRRFFASQRPARLQIQAACRTPGRSRRSSPRTPADRSPHARSLGTTRLQRSSLSLFLNYHQAFF